MSRGPSENISRIPVISTQRGVSVPTVRIPHSPTVREISRSEPRHIVGSGVTTYIDRYILLDGSMVTATVFEMRFSYGDATPAPIFTLGSGAIIAEVNVWMLDDFDGVGSHITIGRPGASDELMNVSEIDPSIESAFSTHPGKEYVFGETVNLYITPGAGATKGRGVLSVYII